MASQSSMAAGKFTFSETRMRAADKCFARGLFHYLQGVKVFFLFVKFKSNSQNNCHKVDQFIFKIQFDNVYLKYLHLLT